MGPLCVVASLLLPVLASAVDASAGGTVADDECFSTLQVREVAADEAEDEGPLADTFPDLDTGFDTPGPYLEEPSDDEAESPENATALREEDAWSSGFCAGRKTGWFCSGTTRVRCCKKGWNYVKCGSTVRSTRCGDSSYRRRYGGSSSFCKSHHVGFFCLNHRKVQC